LRAAFRCVADAQKRLLELDRSLGRSLRSNDAESVNYRFFSDEAPKTGAVISFSNMKHCAVSWIENHGTRLAAGVRYFFIMRRVRLDLEREYARILSQRPRDAFDQEVILAKPSPAVS
jgi:hypothetical protein